MKLASHRHTHTRGAAHAESQPRAAAVRELCGRPVVDEAGCEANVFSVHTIRSISVPRPALTTGGVAHGHNMETESFLDKGTGPAG